MLLLYFYGRILATTAAGFLPYILRIFFYSVQVNTFNNT